LTLAVRAEHRSPSPTTPLRDQPFIQSLLSALLITTAVLAFVIAGFASAVVGYGLYYGDQVYPGVQAVGVEIGGISRDEATAAVQHQTDAYLDTPITLQSGTQTIQATPAELGVSFDNERTVERAYEFGRSGSWWTDSRAWLDSLLDGHDVGVTPVINRDVLDAYYMSIAGTVGAAPREPALRLSESGQLEMMQSSTGVGIDPIETTRNLRSELTVLGDGPVDIATVEVQPAYTEEALDPLGQRLIAIVHDEFVLERGDYQWVLDPHRLDSLLVIDIDSQTGESELTLDRDRLHHHISNLAEYAYGDGRDARVFWDGESFQVRPSVDGWRIDVDESVDIVAEAIMAGERRAELASTDYPSDITTEVAEEAASYGNQLASEPFDLSWSEGDVQLGGTVIAAALSFEHDADSGSITPSISRDDLVMFLGSISSDVEVRPVNADLRYFNGSVEVISDEESGWEMDREASADAIMEAIDAGETRAEIVVNEAAPKVTADMADEIEIREMLSYGETYYSGSAANRAHNVELATERANGAMVAPGETYSFVESIGGIISTDVGYEQGFGIVATDGGVSTVPSVGGGVCQVSTTIFQAAFWAGMEIGERNWHLYWMPLYGQDPSGMTGLDATVDTSAGLDFTFTNTTDDWIAIVATADGNANRFEIWGTDPDWDVQTEGPNITNRVSASYETVVEETDSLPTGFRSQVENAHDGFDVEIKRWVYDRDGEQLDDLVLRSKYEPASNRVLVGTGN
jgi:vancomycin resistance protein YoaR